MGKIPLNRINFDDFDDYDDDVEYFKSIRDTKQKAKNGKFKENENDGDFHQPQWVSTRRGEGDSYISKRRKARS